MTVEILAMYSKLSCKVISIASLITSTIVLIQIINNMLDNMSYEKEINDKLEEKDIENEEEFKVCQNLGRNDVQFNATDNARYRLIFLGCRLRPLILILIKYCLTFDHVFFSFSSLKKLYIITPTFRRPEQIAELTRLFQTLKQVSNLHWILVEDATTGNCSIAITNLLLKFHNKLHKTTAFEITHIASKPPTR